MAMPNMNASDFSAALTLFAKKEFANAFTEILKANPLEWKDLVTEVPSELSSETYLFEKSGTKVTDTTEDTITWGGFEDYSLALSNREYSSGAIIKRSVLEDDRNTNRYITEKLQGMAVDHIAHLEDVFAETLTSTSALAADGETFYSASHDTGSNLGNLAVSTGGIAASMTNIQTMLTAMYGFTNPQGRYLKIVPDTIVVGNTDTGRAWQQIVAAPLKPGSANNDANPFFEQFKIIMLPQITSATAWYAFETKAPFRKPFIYQTRTKPTVEVTKDDKSHSYTALSYERYVQGGGAWFRAYLGNQ